MQQPSRPETNTFPESRNHPFEEGRTFRPTRPVAPRARGNARLRRPEGLRGFRTAAGFGIFLLILTAALATAVVPASAGTSPVLVEWSGAPPAAEAGWIYLHGLSEAALGLLPADSPLLSDPSARALGLYDDPDRFVLVSPSTYALIAQGALPPAWQPALDETGTPAGLSGLLQSAEALSRDAAQVLIRLPEALRSVLGSPGGRCARLTTPEEALAIQAATGRAAIRAEELSAGQAPGASPEPARTQPAEYWHSLVQAVNTDRFAADLDYLSTTLRTRYYSTEQLNQACQYAFDEFASLGLITSFDPFTYNGRQLKNILGVKLGTVDPSRIVVVVGHIDSTSPDPQNLAPGADDNGSGTVSVLEAARLLAPLSCDYTLYFLCVSAEEQGLIGSEHFAALADAQNLDIRGVLNLDMVSYHTPVAQDLWIEGFHQGVSSVWLMNQLQDNARLYSGLSVYLYPGEGWGSDHEPFHNHGFPAVLAIENEWDSYPCYHRTCDTVEWCNPWLWSRITAATIITAGQLAQVQGALGAIDGMVLVAEGDDPAGVTLRLSGTGYSEQVSDAAGAFAWSSLLPGGYTLTAEKPGYETVTQNVFIESGQTAVVEVFVSPTLPGTVQGTVRLSDGTPVEGARIAVEGQTPGAESGPLGTYTLGPVFPGVLNLCAVAPALIPRGAAVTVGSGQTLTGADFVLEPLWTFETGPEDLTASDGWAWGTDATVGAHSGSRVWGSVLGGNYANCADYRLDLRPISFREYDSAFLSVWMWYRTQSARDGGNLQISTDGGDTWRVLHPLDGYAGELAGTCNAMAGQAAFTGNSGGWVRKIFRLDSFEGQWLRIRFRFTADSATRDLGWYLDDLSIEGSIRPVGVEETPGTDRDGRRGTAFLLSSSPNPAPGACEIRLVLPEAEIGELGVFGVDGRLASVVIPRGRLEAGERRVVWNGLDGDGRPLPSGVWWLRYTGTGGEATRSLIRVR